MLAIVVLCLLASVVAQQPITLGKTITINVPARTNPQSFALLVNFGTPGSVLKFQVDRHNKQVGQEMVLVRHGTPPTKFEYDEIDTSVQPTHVIQFTSSVETTYFGIVNLAASASTYNVSLSLLAADTAIFAWEGTPFGVCAGINPPMYGPPSIALGLKSFAVACARRAQKSSAVVEFRRYTGALLSSDALKTPRGGLFQEPAILFQGGFYVTANTYELPGESYQYDWVNLRLYEDDGTLINNRTAWGSRYIPISRDEFPQLLWDGQQVVGIWHSQYSWQGVYQGFFDLFGNVKTAGRALLEPTSLQPPYGVPSRIRALIRPQSEDIEAAVFRWDGNPNNKKLSFYIQSDYKTPRVFQITGDSICNTTHGGIDLQVLSNGNYVTVHPLAAFGTLQVTLIDRQKLQVAKYITVKHNCFQPNLQVIDQWIFLTTTNNGVGFVTVFSNDLDLVASQPIGGTQESRKMFNPVFKYDPLLGTAMLLYTGEDGNAYVQRLVITFPEAK